MKNDAPVWVLHWHRAQRGDDGRGRADHLVGRRSAQGRQFRLSRFSMFNMRSLAQKPKGSRREAWVPQLSSPHGFIAVIMIR